MHNPTDPRSWADAAESILRETAPERADSTPVRYALSQLRLAFDAPGWMYECVRLLASQRPAGALDLVLLPAARDCLLATNEREPGWFLAFDDLIRCEPQGALWTFNVLLGLEAYDPQVLARFADGIACVTPAACAMVLPRERATRRCVFGTWTLWRRWYGSLDVRGIVHP